MALTKWKLQKKCSQWPRNQGIAETFLHWIQLSKKLLVLLLELACIAVVSVCLVPSCGSSTSPTWLKGNRTDCYTGWPSCNWN